MSKSIGEGAATLDVGQLELNQPMLNPKRVYHMITCGAAWYHMITNIRDLSLQGFTSKPYIPGYMDVPSEHGETPEDELLELFTCHRSDPCLPLVKFGFTSFYIKMVNIFAVYFISAICQANTGP